MIHAPMTTAIGISGTLLLQGDQISTLTSIKFRHRPYCKYAAKAGFPMLGTLARGELAAVLWP